MKTWNADHVERGLELRNNGLSYASIAEELSKEFGELFTKDAVYYVLKRSQGDLHEAVFSMQDAQTEYLKTQLTRKELVATRSTKIARALSKRILSYEEMLSAIEELVGKLSKKTKQPLNLEKPRSTGRKMTLELLISDIQYGQQSRKANCEVFRARLRETTRATILKIKQYQELGYNVEKLVVAILGDIIESAHMHGHDSAIGCEFNTSEQMRVAVESLWYDLLEPIFKLGVPVHVPCVAGNHDRVESGMPSFEPGKSCLSWPIYHGLKMISDVSGYKHVTWDIAKGVYTHIDIYGHGVVYEHGYKLKPAENEMMQRLLLRSRQIGKPMTYFRMGDQHRCIRFGHDELVVNPAICGDNWYSEGKGHTALAGQLLFSYVERSDNKRPLFESFLVQLDFINKEEV